MDVMGIVTSINKVLWGPVMLCLLLGTGIYFSLRMKFIPIRKIKLSFKETFGFLFEKEKKEKVDGEVSSFQSLATAIAAQVGTGNLAGVAGAIVSGGPGAVFWMWISAFFGMGTIFAEAVIAQKFVQYKDGEKVGGPAYYIRYGLNSKFLAGFFAVAIILALGLMGNVVQANSIAASMNIAFNIPKVATGVVVTILVMLIVAGGISRINSVTEKIVPFMALFYVIGSLIIIIMNADMIIPAFKMIFVGAFNPKALGGGIVGVSIKEAFRYGVARGLFSNEAGMGSTPHSHALAKVSHPAKQGLTATLGVIIDTGVICTMTALVVLTTGALDTGFTGAELTQAAFTNGFGAFGTKFVAICLFFFAFTTIIGWYFFGESNIKYLFGKKGIIPYRILVCLVITFGTVINVPLVWELADMFNALMVFPNLIALLGMSSLIVKIANDFEDNFLNDKPSEYENKDIA